MNKIKFKAVSTVVIIILVVALLALNCAAIFVPKLYTELEKQNALIELIFSFSDKSSKAVEAGADIDKISTLPVRERIGRAKSAPFAQYKQIYADIEREMTEQLDALVAANS